MTVKDLLVHHYMSSVITVKMGSKGELDLKNILFLPFLFGLGYKW